LGVKKLKNNMTNGGKKWGMGVIKGRKPIYEWEDLNTAMLGGRRGGGYTEITNLFERRHGENAI